jgi:sensor histidine kinase regulating citrate/malate metabolism
VAEGKKIVLGQLCETEILSDGVIIRRIVGNMLKNALEAIHPGDAVTLSCHEQGGRLLFTVHNPGVMAPHVQLQLFRRSFSTRGESGRGLGTYSMKLFGERYLKGEVTFESNAETGTLFILSLPKQPAITSIGELPPALTAPVASF